MDTHSLVAALTKLRGSHSFDFGFEARAYRQSKYNGGSTRSGSYVFDTTWTRGPPYNSTTAPVGQGFAAFLLGLPASSSPKLPSPSTTASVGNLSNACSANPCSLTGASPYMAPQAGRRASPLNTSWNTTIRITGQ